MDGIQCKSNLVWPARTNIFTWMSRECCQIVAALTGPIFHCLKCDRRSYFAGEPTSKMLQVAVVSGSILVKLSALNIHEAPETMHSNSGVHLRSHRETQREEPINTARNCLHASPSPTRTPKAQGKQRCGQSWSLKTQRHEVTQTSR